MLDSRGININFSNFEIIQQFKGHIKIKAPCLSHDPERARIFEILLCKSKAVQSAVASPIAASVAIHFNPVELPLEKLFIFLDTLLGNIGRKVGNTLDQIQSSVTKSDQAESVCCYLINGMKCESCALSLEIILSRHCNISKARVDYNSAILTVCGQLSTQKISALICSSGFKSVLQKKNISG